MPLTTTIDVLVGWDRTSTLDLSTVSDNSRLRFGTSGPTTLASGTGANQADLIWHDTRSILTTANDDLDLTALVQSIFGANVTINFAKVSGIFIVNNSTTAGEELLVKADATNGFTGWCNGVTTSVGWIGASSPWNVGDYISAWATSGTNKVLRINNPNATTVSYSIVIFGRSA